MVVQGKVPRGVYCPLDTSVNLPVPSDRALCEFRPCGIDLPSTLKPGIIDEKTGLVSLCLMVKKLYLTQEMDVFLRSAEDEPKLADIQAKFEGKISRISMLIESFEHFSSFGQNKVVDILTFDRETLQNKCKSVVKDLSNGTKSLRETYAKKKSYLVTLQKSLLKLRTENTNMLLTKQQHYCIS